ncbi:hypothetical protein K1719_010884 [Acacia pycnantha]|nr:hypothetical protein K1719_010884 [Acacia pycnantha]
MEHNLNNLAMVGGSSESSFYSDSDSYDEVTSSLSAPSLNAIPPANAGGAALDMSALLLQLPVRRGLSEFYQGKSQSFSSLAMAALVGSLAKPENPYNRMVKAKAWRRRHHRAARGNRRTSNSSRASSIRVRRSSPSTGPPPPVPPPEGSTTTSITNRTELFVCEI